MGITSSTRRGAKADINVTPYIDILLVLLIIFMVVTPVRQTDLSVRVPQPSPQDQTVGLVPEAIVVSIGESGEIAINQVPTEISTLGSKLQEIYGTRPNKNMFIAASPTFPYGDVVKVIDISKGAGVGDIGLISGETR